MSEAPGKHYRKGISLHGMFRLFPNDEAAEKWFVNQRWPAGVACPHGGSMNVQTGAKHKTIPCRCREKECARRFSAKTGMVMEGSKLGFQAWMIATNRMTTSLKGVSSMKLHRDLDINQRSAWFLAHRLRVALADKGGVFSGPVEMDETYFGGLRRNLSNRKRKDLADPGRGAVGKVAGIKDRETNKVKAQVVNATDQKTFHPFIGENVKKGTKIHTDDATVYDSFRTSLDNRPRTGPSCKPG